MISHVNPRITTVRAAAGTGKTHHLTLEYLRRIAEDKPVESIVAITFTRRAAAELITRVSGALHLLLDSTSAQAGRAHRDVDEALLDQAQKLEGLTQDRVRAALAGLASAPIGTIDSFVQGLLAEHALHLRLPLGGDTSVPLDLPLAAGGDPTAWLTEAARQLVAPSDQGLDPRVAAMLETWTLAEVVEQVGQRQSGAGAPPATFEEVFGAIARNLVQQMAAVAGPGRVRAALADALDLDAARSRWASLLQDCLKPTTRSNNPAAGQELADWLAAGTMGPGPDALGVFLRSGAKGSCAEFQANASVVSPGDEICAHLAKALGWQDVRQDLTSALGLSGDPAPWEGILQGLVNRKGKDVSAEVASWLARGGPAPGSLAAFLDDFGAKAKKDPSTGPLAAACAAFAEGGDLVLSRLQATLGLRDPRPWICEALGLSLPPSRWAATLAEWIKATARGTAAPVAAWLHEGPDDAPPPELPFALAAIGAKHAPRVFACCFGVSTKVPNPSGAVSIPFLVEHGVVRVPLSRLDHKDTPAFLGGEARRHAETLRSNLHSLRREATRAGLLAGARAGDLGYDDLLEVAIGLCIPGQDGTPNPLRNRFQALLVDEVQDSSPAQVRFYQALLATNDAMVATFVGDSRQSIYLFRGAAPAGLDHLAGLGMTETLPVNYRSDEALVAAHCGLFGPGLGAVLTQHHLRGLDSLEGLLAHRKGDPDAKPVTIVTPAAGGSMAEKEGESPPPVKRRQADTLALWAFRDTVLGAWAPPPGEKPVTAAVICPTWAKAREARDLLGAYLGRPDAVFVDSGSGWLSGRVSRDLRIILAALLDPGDQVAWLGLWKHPMVGLSDRALALVRRGQGLLQLNEKELLVPPPPWTAHLGWVHLADALDEAYLPADRLAFARAVPHLRAARDSIGKRPLAEILEELVRQLRWRVALAAGPDPDALAHLEVALEWVRSMDAEGRSALEVLERFNGNDEGADLPRLELHRPAQHVSCTTVFQCKGLKYDHVCVLSPGVPPMGGWGGGAAEALEVQVGDKDAPRLRLEPLRFDPDGAFAQRTDPVGHLCSAIAAQRKLEEDVRLAYVAITRAARTVVFGLPEKGSDGAQEQLRLAWTERAAEGSSPADIPGVTFKPVKRLHEVAPLASGSASVREGATLSVAWAPAPAWTRQAPSHVGEALAGLGERASEVGHRAAAAVVAGRGYQEPLYELIDAPKGHTDDLRDEDKRGLGTLVHAWFARWAFQGPPSLDAAHEALREDWGADDPDLAAWLHAVADQVFTHPESQLWQLVKRPGVQLHFELPMMGVARFGQKEADPLLLAGRTDLLVRDPAALPAHRWTVVDFKAGAHSPTLRREDSVDEEILAAHLYDHASLRSYGPQLEAYREALNGAFSASGLLGDGAQTEQVGQVALWFVRTGAALWW